MLLAEPITMPRTGEIKTTDSLTIRFAIDVSDNQDAQIIISIYNRVTPAREK